MKVCIVFIFTVSLFFGCDMGPDVKVIPCSLPDMPAWWNNRSWNEGFRVVYRDHSGKTVKMTGSGDDFFSLPLPLKVNTPVLVYPAGSTVPAGAVLPWDVDEKGRLKLSWEHGWAALLLYRLSSGSDVSRAMNARRFMEEVMFESGGDPWTLDMDHALRSLSYGRFNSYGFSSLCCYNLILSADPGLWIPDNPFREPLETGESGYLEFEALEEGYHRYRFSDGAEIPNIYITPEDWTGVYRISGVVQSATW